MSQRKFHPLFPNVSSQMWTFNEGKGYSSRDVLRDTLAYFRDESNETRLAENRWWGDGFDNSSGIDNPNDPDHYCKIVSRNITGELISGWTFAVWYKNLIPDDDTNPRVLFSTLNDDLDSGSSDQIYFINTGIYISSNNIENHISFNGAFNVESDNDWHCLVLTRTPGFIEVYHDCVLRYSSVDNFNPSSAGDYKLPHSCYINAGLGGSHDSEFLGDIDNALILHTSLTSSQVSELCCNAPDLFEYYDYCYPLTETTGTNAHCVGFPEYDGTLNSGFDIPDNWITGDGVHGLEFPVVSVSGSQREVAVYTGIYNGSDDWSFSCCFKPDTLIPLSGVYDTARTLMSSSINSLASEISVSYSRDKIFVNNYSQSYSWDLEEPLIEGQWYSILASMNRGLGAATIYLNAKDLGTKYGIVYTDPIVSNNVILGNNLNSINATKVFQGSMKNACFYRRTTIESDTSKGCSEPTPTVPDNIAILQSGNAIKLNGTDQYMRLDNTFNLNNLEGDSAVSYSISWWENWTHQTGDMNVFSSDDDRIYFDWHHYQFFDSPPYPVATMRIEGKTQTRASIIGPIESGWHHWTLNISFEGVKLYRDRELDMFFDDLDIDVNEFDIIQLEGTKIDNIGARASEELGTTGNYNDSTFFDFNIYSQNLDDKEERENVFRSKYPNKDHKELLAYRLDDSPGTGIITDFALSHSNSPHNATIVNVDGDSYFTGLVPGGTRGYPIITNYAIYYPDTGTTGITITGFNYNSGDLIFADIFLKTIDSSKWIPTATNLIEFYSDTSGWYKRFTRKGSNSVERAMREDLFWRRGDVTGENFTFGWDKSGFYDVAVSMFSVSGNTSDISELSSRYINYNLEDQNRIQTKPVGSMDKYNSLWVNIVNNGVQGTGNGDPSFANTVDTELITTGNDLGTLYTNINYRTENTFHYHEVNEDDGLYRSTTIAIPLNDFDSIDENVENNVSEQCVKVIGYSSTIEKLDSSTFEIPIPTGTQSGDLLVACFMHSPPTLGISISEPPDWDLLQTLQFETHNILSVYAQRVTTNDIDTQFIASGPDLSTNFNPIGSIICIRNAYDLTSNSIVNTKDSGPASSTYTVDSTGIDNSSLMLSYCSVDPSETTFGFLSLPTGEEIFDLNLFPTQFYGASIFSYGETNGDFLTDGLGRILGVTIEVSGACDLDKSYKYEFNESTGIIAYSIESGTNISLLNFTGEITDSWWQTDMSNNVLDFDIASGFNKYGIITDQDLNNITDWSISGNFLFEDDSPIQNRYIMSSPKNLDISGDNTNSIAIEITSNNSMRIYDNADIKNINNLPNLADSGYHELVITYQNADNVLKFKLDDTIYLDETGAFRGTFIDRSAINNVPLYIGNSNIPTNENQFSGKMDSLYIFDSNIESTGTPSTSNRVFLGNWFNILT